jgi:hypothetical protein
MTQPDMLDSTSDRRVENNVLRHEYRVLSDYEKEQMRRVKDLGGEMLAYVTQLGNSRETALAKTKIEEAVMWATKHITR